MKYFLFGILVLLILVSCKEPAKEQHVNINHKINRYLENNFNKKISAEYIDTIAKFSLGHLKLFSIVLNETWYNSRNDRYDYNQIYLLYDDEKDLFIYETRFIFTPLIRDYSSIIKEAYIDLNLFENIEFRVLKYFLREMDLNDEDEIRNFIKAYLLDLHLYCASFANPLLCEFISSEDAIYSLRKNNFEKGSVYNEYFLSFLEEVGDEGILYLRDNSGELWILNILELLSKDTVRSTVGIYLIEKCRE
jgi:hypothetical protein